MVRTSFIAKRAMALHPTLGSFLRVTGAGRYKQRMDTRTAALICFRLPIPGSRPGNLARCLASAWLQDERRQEIDPCEQPTLSKSLRGHRHSSKVWMSVSGDRS